MSFGWSVGDIAQAILIVTKIVRALDSVDGAPAHYREAALFLTSLIRTLKPLETFESAGLDPTLAKEARDEVCMLKPTLERFLDCVSKYEHSLGSAVKASRYHNVGSKLKWRFVESSVVEELKRGLQGQLIILNNLVQRYTLETVLGLRDDLNATLRSTLKEVLAPQLRPTLQNYVLSLRSNVQASHEFDARNLQSMPENTADGIAVISLALASTPSDDYDLAQQYMLVLDRIEKQGTSIHAAVEAIKKHATGLHGSPNPGATTAQITEGQLDPDCYKIHVDRLYNMPPRTKHSFVGREDLLKTLSAKNKCTDVHVRLALNGLSGIGKSCSAQEYALRVSKEGPQTWVFWLDAKTETSFLHDYMGIAPYVRIISADGSSHAKAKDIKEWLASAQSAPWLMIVDNIDDGILLGSETAGLGLIPTSPGGSVIFTTRNKQIAVSLVPMRNIVQVLPLDSRECLELLGEFLDLADDNNEIESAKVLLSRLGGLPLAIHCAGSFILAHCMSTASYLQLFDTSEQDRLILLNDVTCGSAGPSSAILTLLLSFEQIQRENSIASDILSFMGCISNRNMPKGLLPTSDQADCAEHSLATALGLLKAYSLITTDDGEQTFQMHAMVHLAVRHWLQSKHQLQCWSGRALTALSQNFPSDPKLQDGSIAICARFQPHVEQILLCPNFLESDNRHVASLAHRLSRYLQVQGRFIEGENFAKMACNLSISAFGDLSSDHLIKCEAHATLLRENGKFQEALQIEEHVLSARLKTLGESHQETLSSQNNIALSLQCLGQQAKAEKIHRLVLSQRKALLGMDHLETMSSLNNLSYVLQQQKKYEEAEECATNLVKLKRRVCGRHHASTLQSMSTLAIVLQEQGKTDRAMQFHDHVLNSRKALLGKRHPLVLRTTINMIGTLVQQGKLVESEVMAREVLQMLLIECRSQHPDVLLASHNLAWILFKLEKYDEAERLAHQTLGLRFEILGGSHPATASTQELLLEILQVAEDDEFPPVCMSAILPATWQVAQTDNASSHVIHQHTADHIGRIAGSSPVSSESNENGKDAVVNAERRGNANQTLVA